MKPLYVRMCGTVLAGAYFVHYALTPKDWHAIDFVNLIFHEAGHIIFFFFGEFIRIAMGSGLQVLLPLFIACYFFYTRQNFAGSITLMWVGQNIINVSVYAGDAVAMQLPLLGGDSVIHDWHYLLSTLGVLGWTPAIASALSTLGFFTILSGILLSCMFIRSEH